MTDGCFVLGAGGAGPADRLCETVAYYQALTGGRGTLMVGWSNMRSTPARLTVIVLNFDEGRSVTRRKTRSAALC